MFRQRVLSQFTNYRTEWRNPSTHDYQLDFDESEAFLAIVSVSAFACVLIDQISEKIAFMTSQKETEQNKEEIQKHIETEKVRLIDLATEMLKEFSKQHGPSSPIQTETQLLGSLTGFFSTLVPDVTLTADYRLDPAKCERADLLISQDSERILVELKRSLSPRVCSEGIIQLEHYMLLGGVKQAILFVYPPSGGEVTSEEHQVRGIDGQLIVIKPASAV